MKTYLHYKNDIQGLTDVAETVKTVEKIAASSIHLLKREVTNLNFYTEEMRRTLARFSLLYQTDNHPFLRQPERGKKALVVLTGSRGLVGGLWHDLVNAFLEDRNRYQTLIAVGGKTRRYLKEENVHLARSFAPPSAIPQPGEIEVITNYIFDQFRRETLSQVDVLYPHFVTLAKQRPSFTPFLPFKFETGDQSSRPSHLEAVGLPIFEPSKAKIFDWLLNKYIGLFFHKIVMEAKLSELSARTVAMEQAGAKTKTLLQKLTLSYMKERRRRETQKQLESFVVHQIT